VVVATCLAAGFVSACGGEGDQGAASSGDGGAYRVGVVLPFTGTLSFYGQEYRRGFDLAAAKINADGGVDGKKIKLVYANGPTQSASADAVRKFNADGIKVYTGTGSSTFDLADSTVGERLKIVTWSVLSLDSQLTSRGYNYTLQVGPHTETFIKPSLDMLNSVPGRLGIEPSQLKIALVTSNDAYGQSNAKAQKAAIETMGAKLVLEQSYDKTATDLTPVVQRIKAAKPDVVLQTGYNDDVTLMWRNAKTLGYAPPYFIGSGGANSKTFADALGDFKDGFLSYGYTMPTPEIKGSVEFGQAYEAKYKEPLPAGQALGAYAGLLKLADTLKAAGTDDPTKIVAAAKGLDNPIGTYPDGCGMKLNETGQNQICGSSGFQWQGGDLITVYPKEFATKEIFGPVPASKQ
jgi:branched-chain amino acid transport system substrate-binding protein